MRHLVAFLCWLVLSLQAPPASAQANRAAEDAVKAGFIFNFMKYTQWPAGSDAQAMSVCATAGRPLDGQLQLLNERSIGNQHLVVHLAVPVAELPRCRAAFFTADPGSDSAKGVRSLEGMPVLTIGDVPGFAQNGGMIELRRVDDRIRFIVNLAAAERAGLRLSSQMLKLAEQVLK